MWDGFVSDGAIGTVESTSVYPEQDADEFGNFVVFLKIEQTFTNLTKLSDAVKEKTGDKTILIDSRNHGCDGAHLLHFHQMIHQTPWAYGRCNTLRV